MEEEELKQTEISIMGKDIQTLLNLPDLQDKADALKARIIHNRRLASMQGIDHLINLLHLNLSCNMISQIEGLHNMRNLRLLNLSTNKIRVINGLAGLYSLEQLDLSFNRISSLMNMSQLYGPQYPFFARIDIRGNNIEQVREINYLAGCQYLRDVAFQGQSGSNPVCKVMEYQYSVVSALPALQYLDQKPVAVLNVQTPAPLPKPTSPKTGKKESIQKVDKSIQLLPTPNVVQREFQSELLRLQHQYQVLFEDNKELLLKYDQNDKYWMERCQRLDSELSEKTDFVADLQRQVAKLKKTLSAKETRLELVESELGKVTSVRDTRDKAVDDLHSQIAKLMRDLGESQKSAQNSIEESYRLRDRLELVDRANTELRAQLKQAEQTIGQLHERTVESSNSALQRMEETQRKWEASELKSEQVERENDLLKARVKELLELNEKMDQICTGKVKEADMSREHVLNTMKLEVAQIASQERERAQNAILQEKEKYLFAQKDLEDEWRKKLIAEQEKGREMNVSIQNRDREKADLQTMLKMSVEKEARSKGLIEELTELIKQMQESIDSERRESSRIKARAEEEVGKAQKQADFLQAEHEKLAKKLGFVQAHVEEDETLLAEKSREVVKLKRELQDINQHREELEDQLSRAKSKYEKTDFAYSEDIAVLQQRVSELEEKVATQNVIIEDQLDSIKKNKVKIQGLEDELQGYQGQRDQLKITLESKLRDAYDDVERLQKKGQESETYVQDLEDQLEQMKEKRNQEKETIKTLNAELQDKSAAIEAIETEVLSMQEARKGEDAQAIAERDKIIDNLKRLRDELTASLKEKEKAISDKAAIMRSMQSHIEQLELELKQAQVREEEMQKEIKVLLFELDRQKQQKAEAMKNLAQFLNS